MTEINLNNTLLELVRGRDNLALRWRFAHEIVDDPWEHGA